MISCRRLWRLTAGGLVLLAFLAGAERSSAQLCVQLNGAIYRQNFNTLAVSGTSNTSSTIPIGFAFAESGTGNNVTYAADAGASSTANTYSYGTGTNADRAFGEMGSDVFSSILGACFVNNTGFAIQSFSISYTGEMWRLGTADASDDKLDFQFSTTATSLNTGTYTDVNTLDFTAPNNAGPAGAKDGNAAANRTTKSPTAIIPSTPIPFGATFFIRWVPFNVSSSDDGLAIDDFAISITPTADFDLSGATDGNDFIKWQRGNGTKSGASISVGDGNKDGAVDGLDLFMWKEEFDAPPFAAVAAVSPVPEPGTAALSCAAALTLVGSRRMSRLLHIQKTNA